MYILILVLEISLSKISKKSTLCMSASDYYSRIKRKLREVTAPSQEVNQDTGSNAELLF